MSRVRQTIQQEKGNQVPQGVGVHNSGNPKGKKKKNNPSHM